MAPYDTTEPHRRIGWNCIQFELPSDWETIVSGDRNLLLEQNFKPLIDLRWEKDTSRRELSEIFLSVKNVLGKRSGSPVTEVGIPEELAPFAARTKCIAFSWAASEGPECQDDQSTLNGVIWRCADCETIFICQLYKHPKISLRLLGEVLCSIQCHQPEDGLETATFWSIQDIRITLPASCRISSHSFQAGLTRLSFQENDLQLHFGRLAPAEQRLQHGSMSQLLTELLGQDAEYQGLNETSHLYECISSPPLTQQMLKRLRRQHPFRWGRIWHDEAANRLLTVIAESKRPIDLEKVHTYCDQYEIIRSQTKHAPKPPETKQN